MCRDECVSDIPQSNCSLRNRTKLVTHTACSSEFRSRPAIGCSSCDVVSVLVIDAPSTFQVSAVPPWNRAYTRTYNVGIGGGAGGGGESPETPGGTACGALGGSRPPYTRAAPASRRWRPPQDHSPQTDRQGFFPPGGATPRPTEGGHSRNS